jgi:ubiquinone/menaquinone biosynthesis C-methylase UbiE
MSVQKMTSIPTDFLDFRSNSVESQGLDKIMDLAWGFSRTGTLIAALELEVFDCLYEGYQKPEEIAEKLDCSLEGIKILLEALVGLELLDKNGNDTYTLPQDTTTYLVKESPSYIGHLWKVHKYMNWSLWSQLTEGIKTGTPRKNLFSFQKDKLWEIIIPYLNSLAYPVASSIVRILAEKNIEGNFSVLDIGCGSGIYSQAIAKDHPNSRIVGVDQENVIKLAEGQAKKLGIEHQVEYLDRDIFEMDFAEEFDIVILSNILHGFEREKNLKLLENSCHFLKNDGLIIINEFVSSDDIKARTNLLPLLFSLQFFLVGKGQVYGISDYCNWLKDTGFTEIECHSVPGPTSLLLGTKKNSKNSANN